MIVVCFFGIIVGLVIFFAVLESFCKTDAQRKTLKVWIKIITFLGVTCFMASPSVPGESVNALNCLWTGAVITLIVHLLIEHKR